MPFSERTHQHGVIHQLERIEVIDDVLRELMGIHTTCVVHEVIIDFEGDGDRPVCHHLLLHQLGSGFAVVPSNVVILIRHPALRITSWLRVWRARRVDTPVRVACFLGQAKVAPILSSDEIRKSTFASLSVLTARYDVLCGEDRLLLILRSDAHACLHHAGGGERVARTTLALITDR